MKIYKYYCDGSCSGNPGPGGFGVVCLEKDEENNKNYIVNEYSLQNNETTNNREELKAILYVMKLAADDKSNIYEAYSDSAYAVNSINNWIKGWAKNNWKNSKKKEVENVDLMKEIYSLLEEIGFNFSLEKVSGHSGLLGNEIADALATNNLKKLDKLEKDFNLIYIN